jgi:hypothetical protein
VDTSALEGAISGLVGEMKHWPARSGTP